MMILVGMVCAPPPPLMCLGVKRDRQDWGRGHPSERQRAEFCWRLEGAKWSSAGGVCGGGVGPSMLS